MCIFSAPSAPDTSRQEAEASRQREEERARYEQNLAEQRRIADEQRLANERQAAEQRALLQQQFDAQRSSEARAEQQRAEAAAAAEARAEAERQAAAEAARVRAQRAEEYTTGRNMRINEVTGNINQAYAGFDDGYFDQFAKDYISYYQPQVQQQYDDARKRLTFKFARQGGTQSSAAADEFARLTESRKAQQARIADQAANAVQSFRDDIDTQRRTLLGDALSATNIGPEVLPEGVQDVGAQLEQLSSRLNPFVSLAKNRASGVSRPQLTELGQVFEGFTGGSGSSSSGGAETLKFNTSGLYQPQQGAAVRVVS